VLVRSLTIREVRNLAPATLSPAPRFNVFIGDNGQGKTNLLEALYVVCALRSFRTGRLAEILRLGAAEAQIAATIQRVDMEQKLAVAVRERAKVVRLDGKAVRPLSKYFGSFNAVLFAPEDLQAPRGSPKGRRRFLDRSVFNLGPDYLVDVQRYEKALRSRNAVLRDSGAAARRADLLEVYDHQIGTLGARLVRRRAEFLTRLEPRFHAAFEAITRAGLRAGLRYEPSVGEADSGQPGLAEAGGEVSIAREIEARLREERPRDLARGATSSGPHRDDLTFLLDGQPAQRYASQGQLRALVLAWKTAEIELLSAAHGEAPVFLLDDVSSELDAARNAYLFDFLAASESQCFITTTHPKHVLLERDRVDFEVRSGSVSRLNAA
jgi:DNA replication and repair protein RecF